MWRNKNFDRTFFRFVTEHAFDGQTDGRTDRTDRILIDPRLHSMRRCKELDSPNGDVTYGLLLLLCLVQNLLWEQLLW